MGVRLAAIFLGDKFEAIRVAAHHFGSFVGGGAVHDDVLDIRVILPEHALDRVGDEAALVIRRSNDGDQRQELASRH
jgi:hypothetical protein